MSTQKRNKLGEEGVGKLLFKFAVPSIIAMLVGALYNIVDQFFIGQSVGEFGNAATNIAFPLSISCLAIVLLCGIGGASAFNLSMGKWEKGFPLLILSTGGGHLVRADGRPEATMICNIIGAAPCFNQLAMMVVQIVMTKSLKYYGSHSQYGETIPIACTGIISKVNMVYMSFIIGTSQGLQPISSFNYGALILPLIILEFFYFLHL